MSWLYTVLAEVPKPKSLPVVSATNGTVQNIFNVVLALAGAVAIAYIVWAGIKYMLSRGEPAEIKQAREAILYAVIGLVVVVISFMVVNYIIGRF